MRIFPCLLLFAAASPLGAETLRFVAAPQSQLILAGDSTLHKYKCVAQSLVAEGDLKLAKKKPDTQTIRTAIFEGKMTRWIVRVPVVGLKSEHSGLDENLQNAMNAAQYPEVVFKMASYEADPGGPEEKIVIKAKGTLAVAGKTREISLTALVTLTDSGFTVTGKKDILMSDYNVVPPKLFAGTVTTDDKVEIHFNLKMQSLEK